MHVSVESVWQMECKDFLLRMKHLEAILAEDRYILQRQLDNHIKIKSKKTVDSFSDIYTEFAEQMKTVSEFKYKLVEADEETLRKKHAENLKKLGL